MLSQRWLRNAPHICVPWKFSGLPNYAHGYFPQNFSWAFVPIDPVNMRTKFEVCSFTYFWHNRRLEFRVGLRTSNLGKGVGVGGRGWYRSKDRWWVPTGPHSNFYSVFTRFWDIAAFVLQNATFPYTPTLVSQKFRHVPVGLGGSLFGHKEQRCWANSLMVYTISFQDFQPMWSQITIVTQTDRWTDGQTDDMRSQDRALH